MEKLIYGQDARLVPWAEAVIGAKFRPDAHSIGWGTEDAIRAVTVFDGFSDCDCNMHIASDGTGRWMTRAMLYACFAYPFVQLGFRRVTGLVPAKNEKAIAFDLHLGFEREGLCRNALPDDDLVILGMLREHCRFIPRQYRTA